MDSTRQQRHTQTNHRSGFEGVLFGLLISLIISALVLWKFQAIIDWWHLRGYQPSAQISEIATSTTMSDYGRRLFYVNHPVLLDSDNFSKHCQVAAEKTIVLGCYKGGDRGIYLYNVTDERLSGVIETTAAHEMLHAGYARLSSNERQRIDTLLEQYYTHNLTDERIRTTIEAYKISEPTELNNEMHSIFATELRELPAELESYYENYFSNRTLVVGMTERYQAEFTSRRDQAEAYDKQLATLKPIIDANQTEIKRQYSQIESTSSQLDAYKKAGRLDEYNQLVDTYNAKVHAYNALLTRTQSQIDEYNAVVEKRNGLALEERALTEALSGKSL
jgi:hypothetical protein